MDSGEQEEPVSKPAASTDSETSDSDDEVTLPTSLPPLGPRTCRSLLSESLPPLLVDCRRHQREEEGKAGQRFREEERYKEEGQQSFRQLRWRQLGGQLRSRGGWVSSPCL